jgi:hypothetical protein
VTESDESFLPGVELTVPDGWLMEESDWGELKLIPAAAASSAFNLWHDVSPTHTNNQDGKAGQVIHGADESAEGIISWLTSTPDIEILDGPEDVTIGNGIDGQQLTLTTSETADFADPGCPDNPRCVALFHDNHHWALEDFYAIGGDEVARIFIAPVHFPEGDHTFFVVLDAPNEDALRTLAEESQPILDSLQLPEHFVDQ